MFIQVTMLICCQRVAKPRIDAFYRNKLALGEYYLNNIMTPDIKRLEMRIDAGAATAIGQFIGLSEGDLTGSKRCSVPRLRIWKRAEKGGFGAGDGDRTHGPLLGKIRDARSGLIVPENRIFGLCWPFVSGRRACVLTCVNL